MFAIFLQLSVNAWERAKHRIHHQVNSIRILCTKSDLYEVKPFTGLYQWGTDALIIADTGNYCLRLLNYSTGRITELAGRCTVPDQRNTANRDQIGHRNSFKDIRFMEPTVITEDIYEENNIYMIDHQEVLRINLAERLIKKHKESQYHLQGKTA